MKTSPLRPIVVTLSLLTGLAWSPRAGALAAATGPVVSPFDRDDPEIQRILKLNWKDVDFDKLDDRHRLAALYAMNRGLTIMGSKADARLDLLIDYVEAQQLGEALAEAASLIPPPPALAYADFQKMGAAFVQTAEGKVRTDEEVAAIPDAMVPAYLRLYENSARREFHETLESRHQVRLIAAFLEQRGEMGKFRTWAGEEKARRQAAHEKQVAEDRRIAADAERARREQAVAAAAERQRQQAELEAKRMDYAFQLQMKQGDGPAQGGGGYDHDGYWGDTWYPYGGAYYAGAVYRAGVRNRAQNAWQRWGGARPTPHRGGGGRR